MITNFNRNIRVFISSTFIDMRHERDYIIKKVFPRLQLEASKRNVSITPVDLRWGVTENEAKNGKVVQACLQEIENSRPFFIGLIGNRYGWCPKQIELEKNPILNERWGDWLVKDISNELSLTEIEMQYGVLRSNEELDAFFYIKNDGIDEEENLDKLELFRKAIRNNGKYPVEDFNTPESLGFKIERAFMALLDKKFPIDNFSEYDIRKNADDAFLNNCIRSYISKEENSKAINDFLKNPDQHSFVLLGESGSGKSSFIANWIQNNSKTDFNVLYHFVGNGIHTSDHYHIIDYLYEGVCRLYNLPIDQESDNKKVTKDTLDNALSQVSYMKPLLIILDGINQILDIDQAKLLNWLPYPHRGVKMLFTTIPNDETYHSFKYRQYPIFSLVSLDRHDKILFIRNYLEKNGKHLLHEQIESIASDPQNDNMLVLRTMLDELLCFGRHNQLNEKIKFYLKTDSIEHFFQKVLKRYETDYDDEFVEKALSLIAFSRSGLQETEIVNMTSVSQLKWSQFYCAFRNNLIISGGFITFSHQYIADAVRMRYADKEMHIRREIIAYFGGEKSSRSKYEIPHQCLMLKEYDLLYSLLLLPDVFQYHLFTDDRELAKYWFALIRECPNKYRLSDYLNKRHDYRISDYFSTPQELAKYYYSIGYFISEYFSDYRLVLNYYSRCLALTNDESFIGTIHNNIGYIFSQMGHYDKAIESHQKALNIRSKQFDTNSFQIAQSYGNLGFIYDKLGKYDVALKHFQESLEIHLKLSGGIDNIFIAQDYNNIGHVLSNMGHLNEGLDYEMKALSIRQILLGDNNYDTAMSYHNVGAILFLIGEKDKSEDYLQKASNIWISILGERHPQVATGFYDLACLYRHMERFEEALNLMEKALRIRIDTLKENHPDTINNYNTLADFYYQLEKYEKSRMYYTKLYKILSSNHDHLNPDYSLQIIVLGGIGMTNCMLGEYEKGESYLAEAINLCESHTPENKKLLMGLRSNLFATIVRRKEGLKPTDSLKITIDINDNSPKTSN